MTYPLNATFSCSHAHSHSETHANKQLSKLPITNYHHVTIIPYSVAQLLPNNVNNLYLGLSDGTYIACIVHKRQEARSTHPSTLSITYPRLQFLKCTYTLDSRTSYLHTPTLNVGAHKLNLPIYNFMHAVLICNLTDVRPLRLCLCASVHLFSCDRKRNPMWLYWKYVELDLGSRTNTLLLLPLLQFFHILLGTETNSIIFKV